MRKFNKSSYYFLHHDLVWKKMFEILGISSLISVNQTNLESFYDDRFPVSVGR